MLSAEYTNARATAYNKAAQLLAAWQLEQPQDKTSLGLVRHSEMLHVIDHLIAEAGRYSRMTRKRVKKTTT